jgi:hypothetical protein
MMLPRANSFFDIVVMKLLASKEGFKMQEQMKVIWH